MDLLDLVCIEQLLAWWICRHYDVREERGHLSRSELGSRAVRIEERKVLREQAESTGVAKDVRPCDAQDGLAGGQEGGQLHG
jgi:hypothetical protein